jgi:hypothetical protein
MIINGLGISNIPPDRKLTFTPTVMDFEIRSADNQVLAGKVPPAGAVKVQPPGKGPWSVKMGIGDFSQRGQVDGVESPDVVVSGVSVFPVPPNNVTMSVNKL